MADPAPKLIVSTVGTSVLMNMLTREERNEKWGKRLTDTANMSCEELDAETRLKIEALARRALDKLMAADISQRREISAELNGIYGIYKCVIDAKARQDMHYLIGTDTYQGRATLDILKRFLMSQNLSAVEFIPQKLSTRNTADFSNGIRELMAWCSRELPRYKEIGYRVIFNLVGGFKALQGYMNTIGMFYADKIVYIFEGSSTMISIPGLPIEFKWEALEPYAVWLAMMEQEYACPLKHLEGISKVLIEDDTKVAFLSEWGEFAWSNFKGKLLSQRLLDFPWLEYSEQFRRDVEKADSNRRIQLQEKLAKVAKLLEESNGDLQALKGDSGLQYENYKSSGSSQIGHFRISQGLRVSCQRKANGNLYLRRFGSEEYVNNNP